MITVIQYWFIALFFCSIGGRLTVTSSHRLGSLFPVGETVVQYTATDTAGNSRVCNLTITVQGVNKKSILFYGIFFSFFNYISLN